MFSIQSYIELFYENIFSITLFVVFLSLFRYLLNNYLERSRLPAGPTGLPVVGYLPFLGKAPHRHIAKLGEKYGNVFTLQLGVNNVVFLNDFQSVKEAFSKDELLGRPKVPIFSSLGIPKSLGENEGTEWREQRRFSLQVMRDLGFGKGSMEEKVSEEVYLLMERIDKRGGQSVDIHSFLMPSMSNNISQLVFGHRFELDDPKRVLLDRMLDESAPMLSSLGVFTTWPTWVTKIIVRIVAYSQKKDLDSVFNIFTDEISNHEKTYESSHKRDYIDGHLEYMHNKMSKDSDTSLFKRTLNSNCFSLFGAGSETVRVTTEWCLLTAAHYSNFQKMVQDEIDEVVGKERAMTYADRLRMPVTQAFICEIFRWKPTVPLNLYRRTMGDVHVQNHLIPNDTLVLANFWAVHNDPKLWNNPDQFDPTRFLSDNGKELIKTEYIMPFSYGKRACIGETLARVEVFLYFATLLQKYTISAVNGQKISFEEKFGISLLPKDNQLLEFKKRV